MKSDKLQEMSNEALRKQRKSIVVITGLLAGVLLVLLIVSLCLWFRKDFAIALPSLTFPLALLPIVLLNLNKLKEIKKELNS